jgi:alpha-beta hydrolase superfamily lysophospholipase
MPMLADIVDAVVGADTHRDTHELEIAHSTGAAIAAQSVDNDTRGHADAVAWSPSTPRDRGSWSRSRAPAATAPGWPAR